jgi:hypothetical protein
MQSDELDTEWRIQGLVLDLEADAVSSVDEIDLDNLADEREGLTVDLPAPPNEGTGLEDLLDEFVELVNARDLDGLAEVLKPDVVADFLDSTSRFGVIDELSELVLRNSSLTLTRGELDLEPVAALWVLDQEKGVYDLIGFLTFEMSDSGDLIQRMDYVDELPGVEDLVVETPDCLEIPEWEVWSAYDEH